MGVTTTTHSPFLDILPPELRLHIYDHLLVASKPLKGPDARQFQSERYNLHTSILRANKQIYSEARHVFFGKNILHVNSVPPLTGQDDEEGSGGFEPPLQLKDLPLVRHLQIDLLYYPPVLKTTIGKDGWGWQPVCPGAERYSTSLSLLLGAVKNSLLSLELAADVRPFIAYQPPQSWPRPTSSSNNNNDVEADGLDMKKFLTGFHTADRNWRFASSLSALAIRNIELRFDFPESYFDFIVEKDTLLEGHLVHLAVQVMIARNEIQLRVTLDELGGQGNKADTREKAASIHQQGIGLLGATEHITLPWPRQWAGEEVRNRYGKME
jgi:hypothetical protein